MLLSRRCIVSAPCGIQVVDLPATLQASGLPTGLVEVLLASGLTLELSVYVAGG